MRATGNIILLLWRTGELQGAGCVMVSMALEQPSEEPDMTEGEHAIVPVASIHISFTGRQGGDMSRYFCSEQESKG